MFIWHDKGVEILRWFFKSKFQKYLGDKLSITGLRFRESSLDDAANEVYYDIVLMKYVDTMDQIWFSDPDVNWEVYTSACCTFI